MYKISTGIIIGILSLLIGCKEKSEEKVVEKKVSFNQDLADELRTMAALDQTAAGARTKKYEQLPLEDWKKYKDSVFRTNEKRLKEIFVQHGFAGFDLAGKEGSFNFWLVVQHSDHNPEFQKAVLDKMKIEVDKKNAHSRNYGLLVDRVNLNTGEAQVYGTQVTYNKHTGQAYPRMLIDSVNVNKRRKSVGLEPLAVYLNEMTEMNFDMNKENMLKRGITKPKLYIVKE